MIQTSTPIYISCFVFILFLFMLYRYWINLRGQKKNIKYILIIIRSTALVLLLIIFLHPLFLFNQINIDNKKIAIFLDNSKSISFLKSSNDLKNKISLIKNQLHISNIESDTYLFGDSIRSLNDLSQINFNDNSTDINQILKKIQSLNYNEYILISDGMQNQGALNLRAPSNTVINVFALKSDYKSEDLSLDDFIITRMSEDSIYIKAEILAETNYNYSTIPIKISNDKVKNKILGYVDIESDKSMFLNNLSISKSDLSTNNIIYIQYLENESNLDNNYYNFIVDSNFLSRKKVLLFSGRLSQNTKYIKSLIKGYSNLDLYHFYDFSDFRLSDIKFDEFDIIVFDSFPTNSNHLQITQDNFFNDRATIFFQGPSINDDYNYYNEYLLKWGYAFSVENNNDIISYDSNNYDLYGNIINKIVPINTNRKLINSKFKKSVLYDKNNNNILIDYQDNNLFIFISNLSKISNETLNIYNTDNLRFLINSLFKKVVFGVDGDKPIIYSDKINYYINNDFNLYMDLNKIDSEYEKIKFFIYNVDGSIYSEINSCSITQDEIYKCTSSLNIPGNYFVQAQIEFANDYRTSSNQIELIFNDLDVEVSNVGLNKKILEDISLHYNGFYSSIEELNNYVNSIKSESYTSLDLSEIWIFDFQYFWFLVVVLLIVEWVVRKNKGLL